MSWFKSKNLTLVSMCTNSSPLPTFTKKQNKTGNKNASPHHGADAKLAGTRSDCRLPKAAWTCLHYYRVWQIKQIYYRVWQKMQMFRIFHPEYFLTN